MIRSNTLDKLYSILIDLELIKQGYKRLRSMVYDNIGDYVLSELRDYFKGNKVSRSERLLYPDSHNDMIMGVDAVIENLKELSESGWLKDRSLDVLYTCLTEVEIIDLVIRNNYLRVQDFILNADDAYFDITKSNDKYEDDKKLIYKDLSLIIKMFDRFVGNIDNIMNKVIKNIGIDSNILTSDGAYYWGHTSLDS